MSCDGSAIKLGADCDIVHLEKVILPMCFCYFSKVIWRTKSLSQLQTYAYLVFSRAFPRTVRTRQADSSP